MAAMRPGAPQFSVGDFIWHEIKYVSETPQKTCSYSPILMLLLKKVTGIKYPADVKHKPLRPSVSKNPRVPSPPAEILEEPQPQPQVQQPVVHGDAGGLDRPHRRSDRPLQGEQEKSTSPVKKFFSYFMNICKSQRAIQIEQQKQWRENKKTRDSIKMMHNSMGVSPARSPISPMPPEVQFPSEEEMVKSYEDSGILHQYGSMLAPYMSGAFASQPPPYGPPPSFPPVYGGMPAPMYGSYPQMPPLPAYGSVPGPSFQHPAHAPSSSTDAPGDATMGTTSEDFAAAATASFFQPSNNAFANEWHM